MDEKSAAGKQPEAKREKKKTHGFRRVLALILTLALIVLAVLAFMFRDRLTGEGLRSVFRGDEAAPASRGDAFTYELGSGQVFAAAGNGLAVASSSAIELLNSTGETVFKQVVSYDTPAVFASSSGALFCDLGGTGCVLAGFDGESASMNPTGELITASMNENGWFTVTTAAAGYKGLVNVYDAGGALRYEWWSGAGYVLKAAVSPDNRMLAVLCAETGGGRLHIFRLDSETEAASAEFEGELPYDLYFMANDRLCAVGEDALTFLTTDGEVKSRFGLDGYYLLDYDFGGQGFAAICVSAYRAAGGMIETLDKDGKLLAYVETDRDVTSLSAAGRQLLAMTAGGLTLYNQDLSVSASREALMTAKKAILRPDGNILLLSSYSAERIKL